MTKFRIRPADIVRWMAALLTLALAGALCMSCWALYRVGTSPENMTEAGVRIRDIYTRENVGEALSALAAPAICWVILLVLSAIQPKQAPKRPPIDPENALRLYLPRVEVSKEMQTERDWRSLVEKAAVFILCGCFYFIHGHVADSYYFTSWDLEWVMGFMVRSTWIPSLIAVTVMCLWAWWEGRSYAAELAAARKAPKRERPLPRETAPTPLMMKLRRYGVPAMRILLAAAAAVLIVLGILNGGMYDVLVKAINICTECIGLG